MPESYAIEVENVSKHFKVFYDKGKNLRDNVLTQGRRKHENRQILNDITFSVKRGEAVGIIGENGCGKSTTLKLLTGILSPDSGTVKMNGRISALIELGAGFHPDMTGRENIYTNAAIFGLSRHEITQRIDNIIDFSELDEFIDNPVRTYSSGMYMRLAFSVAINVDADILLIDEILAVGDAAFQAKCFNKLREIKANGTTIVIVSHSLGQVEQFCERSIWLSEGSIRMDDTPRNVHPAYLDFMRAKYEKARDPLDTLETQNNALSASMTSGAAGETVTDEQITALDEADAPDTNSIFKSGGNKPKKRWGNGDVRIEYAKLLDAKGNEHSSFRTGETLQIVIGYKVFRALEKPACGIGIFRNDDVQCYGTNTQIDHVKSIDLGEKGEVICEIEKNLLMPGEYSVDVAIHTEEGFAYDYYRDAMRFTMYSDTNDVGVFRMEHKWTVFRQKRGAAQ